MLFTIHLIPKTLTHPELGILPGQKLQHVLFAGIVELWIWNCSSELLKFERVEQAEP